VSVGIAIMNWQEPLGVVLSNSNDPFANSPKHSPFYIFMFVVFVFPLCFLMAVWEKSGLSKLVSPLLEEKEPTVMTWSISITHLNPDPVGVDHPWNDEVLNQLKGRWENNCVATVRATVDENWEHDFDTAGSIVRKLNPRSSKQEIKPPGEVIIKLYRIQGKINTKDGPAPKYVMWRMYDGYAYRASSTRMKTEDLMVVYSIRKNDVAGGWTLCQFEVDSFKDEGRLDKEMDSTCMNLDGQASLGVAISQPIRANPEDVVTLMELAEDTPVDTRPITED